MLGTEAQCFLEARNLLRDLREDYDMACRLFRWPHLDRFNWALDYFDRMAASNDRTALWIVDEAGGEVRLSFAELSQRSNQLANWWRALGVQRGDRILMMLGNIAPVWECLLAAMKLGAVIIPATTLLTRDDLLDRFARGGVRHVVTTAAETAKFAEIRGDYTRIAVGGAPGWQRYEEAYRVSPDFRPEGETRSSDPLLLYFTSGTTARPKLVLHSHQSYPVGHLSTMYWLGVQRGDLHLNISTPGWAKHAWSCVFAPWNAEAGIFIFNQPRFNARGLLDAIAHWGVTTFCAPPTVWRLLIQEDLASWKTQLRQVTGAGEPLNPEVIARVKAAWGLTIRDGYGQTETTAQIGNSPGQKLKPGSMGRPLPGYRIRLLDPTGNEALEGEICIVTEPAPTGLMEGYQDDDGKVRPLPPGTYRTGDVASCDNDGYFTYVGRTDDVFKSSDYRISPFELESALIEYAAIAEAAVVPSPDPARLSVPKAFIAPAAGHVADRDMALAIFRHVASRLAPYKRVRRLEFAELPKTISGKIRRIELRQREAQLRTGEGRAPNEFWEEDFPELRA